MDSEAQLIRGVARGEIAAFEELFRRYQPRLTAFFLQRTRDPHAAEELVQETMMVVWERAAAFNGTSRLSTWILGIGHRKFLEWHRKTARVRQFFPARGDDDITEENGEEEAAPRDLRDEVGHQVGRETLIERVRQALQQLPEDHRLVMELTFQQELSYNEIAEVLGIRPGTVKSRMFYAKRRLKEILRQSGMKGDELWQISKGL
jgi:RNA polymerase sigma-70 factor (ECF subfamily)